jgi:hypothetical protein
MINWSNDEKKELIFMHNCIELKFNSIQFNSWIKIQLTKNEIQIGGEGIENLFVNMVLRKKL